MGRWVRRCIVAAVAAVSITHLCALTGCRSHERRMTDVRNAGVTYTFETGYYRAVVGDESVRLTGQHATFVSSDGRITRGNEVIATVGPGDRVRLTNAGEVVVERTDATP